MKPIYRIVGLAFGYLLIGCSACTSYTQVPPSSKEKSSYAGVSAAAAKGDAAQNKALTVKGREKTEGQT
jgi:hypothetical protein